MKHKIPFQRIPFFIGLSGFGQYPVHHYADVSKTGTVFSMWQVDNDQVSRWMSYGDKWCKVLSNNSNGSINFSETVYTYKTDYDSDNEESVFNLKFDNKFDFGLKTNGTNPSISSTFGYLTLGGFDYGNEKDTTYGPDLATEEENQEGYYFGDMYGYYSTPNIEFYLKPCSLSTDSAPWHNVTLEITFRYNNFLSSPPSVNTITEWYDYNLFATTRDTFWDGFSESVATFDFDANDYSGDAEYETRTYDLGDGDTYDFEYWLYGINPDTGICKVTFENPTTGEIPPVGFVWWDYVDPEDPESRSSYVLRDTDILAYKIDVIPSDFA